MGQPALGAGDLAARDLAAAWPGWAHATVGIHPTEDLVGQADEMARVSELAATGQFVAVGETGLDAHHDCAPLDVQVASLEQHLALALDRAGRSPLHQALQVVGLPTRSTSPTTTTALPSSSSTTTVPAPLGLRIT